MSFGVRPRLTIDQAPNELTLATLDRVDGYVVMNYRFTAKPARPEELSATFSAPPPGVSAARTSYVSANRYLSGDGRHVISCVH